MNHKPQIKAGRCTPQRKRINRKKLLEAVGGDTILADHLVECTRTFRRSVKTLADLRRDELNAGTRAAMLYYQAQGRRMSDHCPYGWMRDPENPRMMIEHEGEQAVIKRIVELRNEGLSYRTLCKRLTFEGMMNRSGNQWAPSRACTLFKRATQRNRG